MDNFAVPIEWKNQIVITTAQLAESYGTTTKNISGNFPRNKDRFIEGKHYFTLQGEELKEFMRVSAESGLPQYTSIAYLWTRRGASRHCKILGTDKAWEQFDYLEDNYFDHKTKLPDLSDPMKLLEVHYEAIKQVNRRVDTLSERMDKIELDLPLLPIEADRITEAVRRKGVAAMGGKQSVAYHDRGIRQKVYNNIYANLKYNFSVRSYKAIKRSQCDRAIAIVNSWKAHVFLEDEISAANAQMRLNL